MMPSLKSQPQLAVNEVNISLDLDQTRQQKETTPKSNHSKQQKETTPKSSHVPPILLPFSKQKSTIEKKNREFAEDITKANIKFEILNIGKN